MIKDTENCTKNKPNGHKNNKSAGKSDDDC